MQFSTSTLMALAVSLSLVSAAPAPAMEKRWNSLTVTFEGADPDTTFYVPVTVDTVVTIAPFNTNGPADESISYISYDREHFECTFSAQHDYDGTSPAAHAALACSYSQCQVGPPQAIWTVTCQECPAGQSYCDGYPSL